MRVAVNVGNVSNVSDMSKTSNMSKAMSSEYMLVNENTRLCECGSRE